MSNNVGGVFPSLYLDTCCICFEEVDNLPIVYHVHSKNAAKAKEGNSDPILVHMTCMKCLISCVQSGREVCPYCKVPVKSLAYRVIHSKVDLENLDLCNIPHAKDLSILKLTQGGRLRKFWLNLQKFVLVVIASGVLVCMGRLVGLLLLKHILLPFFFVPLWAWLSSLMPQEVAYVACSLIAYACAQLICPVIADVVESICEFIILWGTWALRSNSVGRKIQAMWNNFSSRFSLSVAQEWQFVRGVPSGFVLPAALP